MLIVHLVKNLRIFNLISIMNDQTSIVYPANRCFSQPKILIRKKQTIHN